MLISASRRPRCAGRPRSLLRQTKRRALRVESLEDRRLLAPAPMISEFMASNRATRLDEDGQSSDWIELVNAGDEAIDLAGWHLTDRPGNLTKWTFPSVTLDPGEYLVVYASNKDRAVAGGELHTDFLLEASGEYLALVEPDGVTIASQFGSATDDYPVQWRDVSYGATDTGNQGTRFVGPAADATYLVPADDAVDTTWMQREFDDSGWTAGTNGFNFGVEPVDPPDELTEYNEAVLADNPLLYWTFDESGDTDPARSAVNDTDDNVMTPQGTASRAASTDTLGGVSLGRAADIGGTAGAMFFAPDLFGNPNPAAGNNDPGFDYIASQMWAVEFWINTSATSAQYVSEAFDAGGSPNNPGLIYNFLGPQFEQFGGGGRWGTPMAANEWHHVVTAFYGNSGGFGDNLREIYIDGVLVQDTASAFSAGHGLAQMAIGNATNGTAPVNGLIDEYAIYELGNLPDLAARQAHVADIVDHRNIAPAPAPPPLPPPPDTSSVYNQEVLADNPLKYWTFDEASGAAYNVAAPANTGDLLNPQGGATRVAHDTLANGLLLGNAADLSGADGTRFYATDLDGAQVGSKWAVEMWVQLLDPTKDSYFLESSQNNPGIIHGYAVGGAANNGLELFQGTRTGDTAPTTLADGQWHHVVIGNDTAGSHTIVIDDGAPATFPGTGGSITSPFALADMAVGGIATGAINAMHGRIDELALYDLSGSADMAASLAELSAHYHVASVAGTDLESEMHDVNATMYARFDFQVADTSALERLELRMKYDDGFIAYVNGTQVAAANEPASPAWNSTATAERTGNEIYTTAEYDISSAIGSLLDGGATNVLAVHGLNFAADDDDFLLSVELVGFDEFTLSPDESYFLAPTPGGPNGAGLPDPGPTITDLFEPTTAPADGDDLVITAAVTPDLAAIDTVALHYRVDYGAETSVAMVDDGSGDDAVLGDGVFTATIPAAASAPGQMVRWYVTADDALGNTSREPLFLVADNSPEYRGTVIADPTVTSQLPIFQWFLAPGTEGAAGTRTGTRASVSYLDRLYDNVFVRQRGESVNGTGKFAYKVNFNQHEDFVFDPAEAPVSEFDLQSTGLDKSYIRPVIGFELMRDAGLPYSITFPMHVRRNGAFFSVALFLEHPEEEYLDRNGLDPDGALYKGALNGFTLEAQGGYRDVHSGFDKQTRQWEDNADMVAFVTGLEQTGTTQTEFVFDNVDLAGVVNFMAASIVIQDADRLVDNYYAYRDTLGTAEWTFVPWDLDLSQGQYQVGSDHFYADDDFPAGLSHPFYGAQAYYQGHSALWNKLIDVVVTTPVFREMYLRRLRTLMDDFLKPPGTPGEDLYFENRIDELFDQMQDDVALDKAAWGNLYGAPETFQQSLDRLKNEYYAVRRTHLFVTHTESGSSSPVDTILDETNPLTALVPTDDSLGSSWTAVGFDDSGWLSGTAGVGYEEATGYESHIDLDLRSAAIPANQRIDTDGDGTNENDSVYVRIPFGAVDTTDMTVLTLRAKYDDGFVAYLNGTPIADANAPATLAWNSAATATHGDTAAVQFAGFDVSSFIHLLNDTGDNVLAIHALNDATNGPGTSTDMLIGVELVSGAVVSGDSAGIPDAQAAHPAIQFGQIEGNPASGIQDEEYIELVNANATSVDVSGWTLTGGVEHTFKPGTVIPADSSLYVTPNVVAFRARAASPTGSEGLFAQGNYRGHISNLGEQIDLLADDGTPISSIVTPFIPSDAQRYLRISEIMYHPDDPTPTEQAAGFTDDDDFEFVELINTSDAVTLDLTGVTFTDGIDFAFVGGTMLAPGERILVVRDTAAFAARYDAGGLNIAGEYRAADGGNKLSNGGETLKLEDIDNSTIQEFAYNDSVDQGWPTSPDGQGHSLEAVSFDDGDVDPAAWNDYGNSAMWYASVEAGGTPGRAATAAVLERFVFYDGSMSDTDNNDAVIAPDKIALRPGQTATAANYTNFDQGVNGVIVDIAWPDDASQLTDTDFTLLVGNTDDPNSWTEAATPVVVPVEGAGRGGSDRVYLSWSTSAPTNTWLQVTARSDSSNTGLVADDVFYFGNAVGETGNHASNALVTAADLISIRDNPRGDGNRADITNPYDINRDRVVDATDAVLARNAVTGPFDGLRLVTPPLPSPAPAETEGEQPQQATRIDSTTPRTVSSEIKTAIEASNLAVGGRSRSWQPTPPNLLREHAESALHRSGVSPHARALGRQSTEAMQAPAFADIDAALAELLSVDWWLPCDRHALEAPLRLTGPGSN